MRKKGERMKTRSIVLPREAWEDLDGIAYDAGVSTACLIRKILLADLEKRGKKNEKAN